MKDDKSCDCGVCNICNGIDRKNSASAINERLMHLHRTPLHGLLGMSEELLHQRQIAMDNLNNVIKRLEEVSTAIREKQKEIETKRAMEENSLIIKR
jgi:hypothetical protein